MSREHEHRYELHYLMAVDEGDPHGWIVFCAGCGDSKAVPLATTAPVVIQPVVPWTPQPLWPPYWSPWTVTNGTAWQPPEPTTVIYGSAT